MKRKRKKKKKKKKKKEKKGRNEGNVKSENISQGGNNQPWQTSYLAPPPPGSIVDKSRNMTFLQLRQVNKVVLSQHYSSLEDPDIEDISVKKKINSLVENQMMIAELNMGNVIPPPIVSPPVVVNIKGLTKLMNEATDFFEDISSKEILSEEDKNFETKTKQVKKLFRNCTRQLCGIIDGVDARNMNDGNEVAFSTLNQAVLRKIRGSVHCLSVY